MGFRFATPNKAVQAKAPDYVRAVIEQKKLDDQAEAQANALRSQQMGGAAELYNAGMGDNTPIADFFGGGGEPTTADGINDAINLDAGAYGEAAVDGGVGPGSIYGDSGAAVDALAPAQEGLYGAADAGIAGDLSAAIDATEAAGLADIAGGAGEVAGIADLAGGADAALGIADLAGGAAAATDAGAAATSLLSGAGTGTAAAGAAGSGGLMSALGAANPYIAAALAAYSLFS
jgi:hypothetical protein